MANPLGDFDASAVIYGKFTTVAPTTGAPGTLGGTPALSVYKDNSTTQSTTGVTLTADFDSVTGLNHYAIDTSADGTFYSAGSFFDVVITTGTVGGVSAVGYCVGSFTIRKTSALKPTTAGRALDVSAGGEAGVDWANVGSPTTTLALTGTTIAVTQKVDIDTIKTNPVVNGGTATFPTNATLASTTNITAGTIATVTTVTGLTASDVGAIKAKTDNLPASPAAVGSAMTLTAGERNSIADATKARQITAAVAADGSAPTVEQALFLIQQTLTEFAIAASTLTVNSVDGTTPLATFTLNSATTPTALTRAT